MNNVSRVFILGTMFLFLGGCHRKAYFFRKKLYFMQTSSAIEGMLDRRTKLNPPPMVDYSAHQQHNHGPIITVWIHGAQPFKRNTLNLGLKSYAVFEHDHDFYRIATMLNKSDPQRFPLDNIFFFSWSGRLDYHERKQAAIDLCRQLTALLSEYELRHHMRPKIYFIAHSHGGNVALNLAKIKSCTLEIEKLILLASPVQDKTEPLLQKSIFKKIYNLYSTLDIIQVIDPQGLAHDHAATTFFSRQRFCPQSNLMQVKVRVNGHSCLHHEFHSPPFISGLPYIIDQLDAWYEECPQEAYTITDSRFVLSIYTNGRMPPRHRPRRCKKEHIIIPISSHND